MKLFKLDQATEVAQLPRKANLSIEGTRIEVTFEEAPPTELLVELRKRGFTPERYRNRWKWVLETLIPEEKGETNVELIEPGELFEILAARQRAARAQAAKLARETLEILPRPVVFVARDQSVIEYIENT